MTAVASACQSRGTIKVSLSRSAACWDSVNHLVRIRWDGIMCWPNLGRGSFGQPFQLAALAFDRATFDPNQLFWQTWMAAARRT